MKTPDQACRKCCEAIRLDAVGALSVEQRSAVEQHLADCAGCRAYSNELRLMAGGLRHLAARPVEPSPDFRARWTSAVRESSRPGPLAQAMAAMIEWSRQVVLQNRRVLATLAPVWVLILLFKLSAPDVGKPASTIMARSPVEIFRAFKAEENRMVAFDRWNREPVPTKVPAASPRSSRATTQPVTFQRKSEISPQPAFLS